MGSIYIGCAVWAYRGWLGGFYPAGANPKDFLRLYCDRLTAVEGNTTFYSIPTSATIQRWAATMPAGFKFCPKLPRQFSHGGPIRPHRVAAESFAASLVPLESRLGPILLQLPPSYGPTYTSDLENFLRGWPQRYPLAVEVRHLAWFQPTLSRTLGKVLAGCRAARVLLDTRPVYETSGAGRQDPQYASERKKPQVPLLKVITANTVVIRYVAHPELSINRPYLEVWAEDIHRWLEAGKTIYFFAHCPEEERSPAIAHQLYLNLKARGADIPPLPWHRITDNMLGDEAEAEADPEQLSLF